MGKYDSVLPKLPALPVADQSYQDKVDLAKTEMPGLTPAALAKEYAHARAERKRLDAEAYALNLRIEALTQLLIESQEAGAEGWGQYGVKNTTLRLVNGDVVRVEKEPYGKVVDKEQFRLWCIAHGYERQLQLWPSTMNALVKERLMAGEEPPGGTEAYARDKLVFTPMKAVADVYGEGE